MSEQDRAAQVVVGIGASAGGLESLEAFLDNLPERPGLAFVLVVQHLDPSHESILPALVDERTGLPVEVARDRAPLHRDHVYVIPPGFTLRVERGQLRLESPVPSPRSLPIDAFFRSLAAEYAEDAVGVILSGAGSDGTLGVQAIKEQGGQVLVEEGARFDGMPRSALATGLVDDSCPAAELPERLLELARSRRRVLTEGVQEGELPVLQILVVDDHVDVAATLAELLEALGQQAWVAGDGEAALERVKDLRPDLVLLDISLPGMGGLEVARRMRAMPDLARTALVALSGFGRAEDRRASHEAGAAAHLVKPIRAAQVEELIRRVAAGQPLDPLEL